MLPCSSAIGHLSSGRAVIGCGAAEPGWDRVSCLASLGPGMLTPWWSGAWCLVWPSVSPLCLGNWLQAWDMAGQVTLMKAFIIQIPEITASRRHPPLCQHSHVSSRLLRATEHFCKLYLTLMPCFSLCSFASSLYFLCPTSRLHQWHFLPLISSLWCLRCNEKIATEHFCQFHLTFLRSLASESLHPLSHVWSVAMRLARSGRWHTINCPAATGWVSRHIRWWQRGRDGGWHLGSAIITSQSRHQRGETNTIMRQIRASVLSQREDAATRPDTVNQMLGRCLICISY